jgi:YVTN family beta-propeller protein
MKRDKERDIMARQFRPWAALALTSLLFLLQGPPTPAHAFEPGPEAVTISPDGSRLYVGNSVINTVSVLDTTTLQIVATVKLEGEDLLLSMAVSPDGSRLYVPRSYALDIIDTAANQVVATVKTDQLLGPLAVDRDGKHVYVAYTDYQHPIQSSPLLPSGGVLVIDAATHQIASTVALGHEGRGVTVSADGKHVYAATCDCRDPVHPEGKLAVIDQAADQVIATVPLGGYVQRVAVSRDSRWVYVVGPLVSLIDAATNEKVAAIGAGSDLFDVAISPDGQRLYLNLAGSNSVSVIDTAARAVVGIVGVGKQPVFLTASPDGKRVYVVNKADYTLSVIDTATLQVAATVKLGEKPTGSQ